MSSAKVGEVRPDDEVQRPGGPWCVVQSTALPDADGIVWMTFTTGERQGFHRKVRVEMRSPRPGARSSDDEHFLTASRSASKLDRMPIQRTAVTDRRGRTWTISTVPLAEAADEDARFWYEELTPAQRVELMPEVLLDCLKTRGIRELPRFRRVYRCVKRKRR
jgi:hypothetical protein